MTLFGTSSRYARIELGLTLVLAAYGALKISVALWRWPLPLGRDGYYYVLQVASITETGAPQYPTSFPAALYWLATPVWLGLDAVSAIKLAVAATQGIFVGSLYLVLRLSIRSRALAVASALLACHVPLAAYLHVEFLSNFVALTLFAVALALLAAIEREAVNRRFGCIAFIAIGILSSLSHRSGGPMFALLAMSVTVWVALSRVQDVARRLRTLTVSIGSIIILGSLTSLMLGRFGSDTFLEPWAASWRVLPSLRHSGGIYIGHWVVTICATLLVFGFTITRDAPSNELRNIGLTAPIMCGAIVVMATTLVANPWWIYTSRMTSIVDRVALWSVALVPICCAIVATVVASRFGQVPGLAAFAAGVATIALAEPTIPGYRSSLMVERQELARQLMEFGPALTGEACIVAEHGIQFMVTAQLNVPSASNRQNLPASCHAMWLLRDPAPGIGLDDIAAAATTGWRLVDEERLLAWIGEGPSMTRVGALATHNSLLLIRDARIARLAIGNNFRAPSAKWSTIPVPAGK